MTKRLSGHTSVTHPDTGESFWFGPADTVPKWAADLIVNPLAWEAEDIPVEASEPEPEPAETDTQDAEADADDASGEVTVPPTHGKGSSTKAWAAYAASQGFEVEGDAKATEIRAALEAEGIPVE